MVIWLTIVINSLVDGFLVVSLSLFWRTLRDFSEVNPTCKRMEILNLKASVDRRLRGSCLGEC